MTFYEALKANETQRVRQVGDTLGYAPGKLIACLEQNMLDIDACNRRAWEVVEEPREFWVVAKNQIPITVREAKERAIEVAKEWPNHNLTIALFREVPGTREEVKP